MQDNSAPEVTGFEKAAYGVADVEVIKTLLPAGSDSTAYQVACLDQPACKVPQGLVELMDLADALKARGATA